MVQKNLEPGALSHLLNDKQAADGGGFTGAQIASAYKAALADFVSRKTNRQSVAEISKLLQGALQARRQELCEKDGLSAQKVSDYF